MDRREEMEVLTRMTRWADVILPAVLVIAFLAATGGAAPFGWHSLNGPNGGWATAIGASSVDPALIYVSDWPTLRGIFVSHDGGATFPQGPTGPSYVYALEPDPFDIDIASAGTFEFTMWHAGGFFRTTDRGTTWQHWGENISLCPVTEIVCDPDSFGLAYASRLVDVWIHGPQPNEAVWKTTDRGETWLPTGVSNEIVSGYAIAIDPLDRRRLYAGTDCGLYRSEDRGALWEHIAFDRPILEIAVSPGDNAIIFVSAPEYGEDEDGVGLRIPEFRAQTEEAAQGALSGGGIRIVPLPVTPLYSASTSRLMGASAGVARNDFCTSLYMTAPHDPLFCGSITRRSYRVGSRASATFRTMDGGVSWEELPDLAGMSVRALAIDPIVPATVYAGATPDGMRDPHLFRSTDTGGSWDPLYEEPVTPWGVVTLTMDLALAPDDHETIYFGNTLGLHRSTDAGETWRTSGVPQPAPCVGVSPHTPELLLSGTTSTMFAGALATGWLFRSTNGGEDWVREDESPFRALTSFGFDPGDPLIIYAGSGIGGIDKSTDAGATWVDITMPGLEQGSVQSIAVNPENPQEIITGTGLLPVFPTPPPGIIKSTNGGAEWVRIWESEYPVTSVVYDPAHPETAYAGIQARWDTLGPVAGGGVYRTTNGGSDWDLVGLGLHTVNSLAIDSSSPLTLYAATSDSGVYKSTDAGDHWSPTGLEALDVRAVAIEPLMPERAYAGTSSDGLWASEDGGLEWWPLKRGACPSRITGVCLDVTVPERVHVSTPVGVYVHEPSPVKVITSPDGTCIPQGGELGYGLEVRNPSEDQHTFDLDAWVELPGGSLYGPLITRRTFTFPAGASAARHIAHQVPPDAPLGEYTYAVRIGSLPDEVWDEAFFRFTVVPLR